MSALKLAADLSTRLLARMDWDCGEEIRRHTWAHSRVCQVERWSEDTIRAVREQHAKDRRAMADSLATLLCAWEVEESERARQAAVPRAVASGVSYHGEIPDDWNDPDDEQEPDPVLELDGVDLLTPAQVERIMEYVRKNGELPPKK